MPETQTDTLHDRIRAKAAFKREDELSFDHPDELPLAFCDHADRILDRHVPSAWGYCDRCDENPPCIEVRDLAEAWGVDQ